MSQSASEEERLLEFLYAAPVGLIQIDASGDIAMMNPHAMKHLLPLAGSRNSGNFFATLENYAPEIRNLFDAFTAERGTICDGHQIVVELNADVGSGHPKVLSCTLVKLAADRAIATLTDITQQVAQERRLQLVDTWFASLLNDVNDYAVLSITSDGIVDAVNDSWARQTGHDVSAAIGKSLSHIMEVPAGDRRAGSSEKLRLVTRDGWHLDEDWHHRSDGTRYRCQRLLVARTDGEGYTLVLRDIVPQSRDTDDLLRQLTQDHLTGAANRAHFRHLLEREQRKWREQNVPLSLVMIDIDHFKRVNDRHGHPTGDEVLAKFSRAISDALRATDVFARVGGEEFAVLLPNTELAAAIELAERLRLVVANMRVAIAGGDLAITASFGCATATPGLDILRHADQALYIAKDSGRDRVHAMETVVPAT